MEANVRISVSMYFLHQTTDFQWANCKFTESYSNKPKQANIAANGNLKMMISKESPPSNRVHVQVLALCFSVV